MIDLKKLLTYEEWETIAHSLSEAVKLYEKEEKENEHLVKNAKIILNIFPSEDDIDSYPEEKFKLFTIEISENELEDSLENIDNLEKKSIEISKKNLKILYNKAKQLVDEIETVSKKMALLKKVNSKLQLIRECYNTEKKWKDE